MTEGRNVIIRFSDSGPETVVVATNVRHVAGSMQMHRYLARTSDGSLVERTFRHVGWLGQTGNIYRFDEEAEAQDNEPGSYGPLYIEVTE